MKVHHLAVAAATAVVVCLACTAMAASTGDLDCTWSDEFRVSDFDDTVGALAVFDDGSGPALYAGGSFWHAGGVLARGIARWTGAGWAPLAGPLGDIGGPAVGALAVFDDGTGPALWLGGPFRRMGGQAAAYVTRYFCDARLFADDFETGTTDDWSLVVP